MYAHAGSRRSAATCLGYVLPASLAPAAEPGRQATPNWRSSVSDSNAGGPVYVIAAAGCVATSALLVWAAMTHAPGLRVPSAVALVLAGATGVAAWRVGQLYRGGAGTGDGSAALVLAAMAVFGLWVAVGGGRANAACASAAGPASRWPERPAVSRSASAACWPPWPRCTRSGAGHARVERARRVRPDESLQTTGARDSAPRLPGEPRGVHHGRAARSRSSALAIGGAQS